MPATADRQDLAKRLTTAGVKPSRNRVTVLAELSAEPDDATAQVIHRRLADRGDRIGLATVYRALRAMSEAGVIDELPHGSTETCYRLCGSEHHHHLVCQSCHRVVELRGCPAQQWIERAADDVGFAVSGHRLEVTGLCASCRG
jgi:Fur family ferric uptake transcriptional regulator